MKLARVATITAVLVDEGLGYLTRSSTDSAEASAEAPEPPPGEDEVARRLRRTLERLGPTFVKFGQMLATRVDLFDEPFIEELSKLHASVEPFPTEQAFQLLADELGRPVDDVFAEIGDAPVAAASIAQVYRARLRGDEEAWVAVKVQRPGLEESLLSDLDALLVLSGFIDRLVPPYRRSMVHRVAEEYALRARAETDFLAEARAVQRFEEVLATLPSFRVPQLHPAFTTPRVLVMQWMEGTKLSDVPTVEALQGLGFDPETFCRAMLELQLVMAYDHGFLHGDTHPGNLILAPDGTVGLIDFGLHGEVPRALRDKMLEMLFKQANGELDEAVDAFVQVFVPEPGLDVDAFKAELRVVLAEGCESGPIAEHRVTEQLVRGMRVGAKYRARAQSDLFMVIRNLTIVEGILLRYYPSMDAAAEVRTITAGILRRRLFGPQLRAEMGQLLPDLALTLSQRPKLAARLLKLERALHDAPTLGDFLRREGVLREPTPTHPASYVAVALLGVLVGLAIAWMA